MEYSGDVWPSVNCIDWDGRVGDHGYGTFGAKLAHRLAWERANGPIPDGMQVHHTCRNKLCQQPAHMVLLSVDEHARLHDLEPGHHNAVKTHCPHGHPYDAENTKRIPSRPTARYCRACHRGRC